MKNAFRAAMLAAALSLFGSSISHAALAWKPAPVTSSSHHGRPASNSFLLEDHQGASAKIYKSDLTITPLELNEGVLEVKPFGIDFYHAIMAEKRSEGVYESAFRYIVLMGKSSGHSPSELVALQKAEFEIAPNPQPREHTRYVSNQKAGFMVRLAGRPVSGAEVRLTASNGGSQTALTGADGSAEFALPDDFAEVKPGRGNNAPAEFMAEARWKSGGMEYRSTLTAPYHPDPRHWQSFPLGLTLVTLGAVAGGLLAFTGKKAKEEDGSNG